MSSAPDYWAMRDRRTVSKSRVRKPIDFFTSSVCEYRPLSLSHTIHGMVVLAEDSDQMSWSNENGPIRRHIFIANPTKAHERIVLMCMRDGLLLNVDGYSIDWPDRDGLYPPVLATEIRAARSEDAQLDYEYEQARLEKAS